MLDALRERMLERNYINNLLAGIERELTRERSTRRTPGHRGSGRRTSCLSVRSLKR